MEYIKYKQLDLKKTLSQMNINPKYLQTPAFDDILDRIELELSPFLNKNGNGDCLVAIYENHITFGGNTDSCEIRINGQGDLVFYEQYGENLNYSVYNKQINNYTNYIANMYYSRLETKLEDEGTIKTNLDHAVENQFHKHLDKSHVERFAMSREEAYYNKDGIMLDKTITKYEPIPYGEHFANSVMALNLHGQRIPIEERIRAHRIYFDTVDVLYESNGKVLKGTMQITPNVGIDIGRIGEGEFKVNPISSEQIQEMLSRQSDPRVVEGLKKLIGDREDFYYLSENENSIDNVRTK